MTYGGGLKKETEKSDGPRKRPRPSQPACLFVERARMIRLAPPSRYAQSRPFRTQRSTASDRALSFAFLPSHASATIVRPASSVSRGSQRFGLTPQLVRRHPLRLRIT